MPNGDFSGTPELDFETWTDVMRTIKGRYRLEGVDPKTFAGWARPRRIYGLEACELSCNVPRAERTHRDVRLDDIDHYWAIFQLAGRPWKVRQNDQVVELTVGDVVLVDSARPATYFHENRPGQWLALHLPRRSLISHLGLEPQGGLCSGGMLAGRSLFRLVRDAVIDSELSSAPAEPFMQLAIYDLLGAIFAASDPAPVSSHTDKLFKRVCGIIKDCFADPDVGPCEIAAEAGISLRYLQKLFTIRGSTCSEFIQLLRLDHAARLLQRRAVMKTGQPLSEIAYTCGFRDYSHFARQFRRRFGHPPGTAAGHNQSIGDGTVRASPDQSAR